MDFPCKIISNSEEDTAEIAVLLAPLIENGSIVFLNGELGMGKTFLVKQLCAQYGIANVSSPSFAIVNEYHNGKKIIHFDFYRIGKVAELYDIGFEDYLGRSDTIIFIEWAELYPEILPKKNIEISLISINESSREIIIKKNE